MENSQETPQRQKKSQLQLLYDAPHQECVPDCHGQWVTCAKEVLRRNDISVSGFAQSVCTLLETGRGKHCNIMLIGPTNGTKTFLLNPLNVIYNTCTNPASGSFAWVGAEKAECLFLNDFRWSSSIIPWHDFLLLLEGQLVHLPAPKTHYAKDLTFKSDTPIFATGKDSFVYTRSGVLDELETDMMAVHWKTYTFHYQISSSRQKVLPPCGRCFTELIVGDSECSWDWKYRFYEVERYWPRVTNSVLKDNVINFCWSFTRLLVVTRQKSSKPRIRKVWAAVFQRELSVVLAVSG